MTAATWSKALFDIDQMRQIRYPLPAESIPTSENSIAHKTAFSHYLANGRALPRQQNRGAR